MSDIEWTDRTWNPIVGCSRVSLGCEHCYAERFVHRGLSEQHRGLTVLGKGTKGPRWTGEVRFVESALAKPLSWRKPQRVFVNSLSDLWHEGVSNETCAAIFGVMAACPHLTFQVLTKRPERMRAWFAWVAEQAEHDGGAWTTCLRETVTALAEPRLIERITEDGIARDGAPGAEPWPLPNVWLGVTAEDQQRADERIPILLDTPAAVRFVSYEPALGPVLFRGLPSPLAKQRHTLARLRGDEETARAMERGYGVGRPRIDWLIVGGESGPKARPFDLAWARSAVEQCKAAGVPVFVKQLGRMPITKEPGAGRGGSTLVTIRSDIKHPKGNDPSEWPADLRVREFPTRAENVRFR